jgi:hypothetical protein
MPYTNDTSTGVSICTKRHQLDGGNVFATIAAGHGNAAAAAEWADLSVVVLKKDLFNRSYTVNQYTTYLQSKHSEARPVLDESGMLPIRVESFFSVWYHHLGLYISLQLGGCRR